MKISTFVCAASLILSMSATAAPEDAKIVATADDGSVDIIALDAKGVPRVNGNSKSYPTIKEFRDGDSEYASFCYEGSVADASALLGVMVEAANGDGDSWAELVSIEETKSKEIVVTAVITNEGGERENTYIFPACP